MLRAPLLIGLKLPLRCCTPLLTMSLSFLCLLQPVSVSCIFAKPTHKTDKHILKHHTISDTKKFTGKYRKSQGFFCLNSQFSALAVLFLGPADGFLASQNALMTDVRTLLQRTYAPKPLSKKHLSNVFGVHTPSAIDFNPTVGFRQQPAIPPRNPRIDKVMRLENYCCVADTIGA